VGWATAIQVHLKSVCGVNAFKDVDSLEPGVDWRAHIDEALRDCTIALILIGAGWIDARGPDGRRRLDHEDDVVRYEVGRVIARSDVKVIPVVIDTDVPSEEDLPDELKPLPTLQVYRWYSNQPSAMHLEALSKEVGVTSAPQGPDDIFSKRTLALVRAVAQEATRPDDIEELARIAESLSQPISDSRGVRAVIGDAARVHRALEDMLRLAAGDDSLRWVRDRVEQLRNSGPIMALLPVARWYERCLRGEIQLTRDQLDELEGLLLGRSAADRLGFRGAVLAGQLLREAQRRTRVWTAVENAPLTSVATQRLAISVQNFYERLYDRIEAQSELGESFANA
jgi:hypothetical protein